ncbi:DUF2953 domain-containing protein [Tenuibacillus multivorans]|uniref:DUF2953 domain-containing protein n=1 Tax=Tenuibacillus multivorans TaxID=237069 RepID=A0A1G9ZWX3_9BACI|nr:DUF2953 domain-containing protein [Tenuibacillus multivorans]GEL76874.1 hypothetical protein TMU01_11090 [Tenuibacillus multivorans]SDN25411.1 Protein of unknown function [Tenuibacillus multivorans]
MVWLAVIIGIVLLIGLLILLLLFSPITVKIMLTYADDQKDLYIEIKVLRFIKIKRSIPLMNIDSDSLTLDAESEEQPSNEKEKSFNVDDLEKQWEVVEKFIKSKKDIIPNLKRTLHTIKLQQWRWNTAIGVDSAHYTAILTGSLYSIKSMISLFLASFFENESDPYYSVSPQYSKPTYQTELKCILSFQLGQIMHELFSIFRKYEKMKKVGTK